MKIIGIYKITSPTFKIYIGQSVDIKERFRKYKYITCKGQHRLINSLKKYGSNNHKFEILHFCEIEELNELERYYQDLFEVIGKYGLNIILTNTDTKKRTMSIEGRNNIRVSRLGKKASEESKLKMRNSANKTHSKEHTQKVAETKYKKVIDLSTNIVYKSAKEASNKLNIVYSTLVNKLNKNLSNTLKYYKNEKNKQLNETE